MYNGIIKEKSNAVAAFGAAKPIFHDRDDWKEGVWIRMMNRMSFYGARARNLGLNQKKIEIDKGAEKLPERSERTAQMSIGAEHAAHETEASKAAQPSVEELGITDELCEDAFREGFAAKDFSVAFFQRQFRLKYIDACNLQDVLRQSGKIKRAFLVGDTVCRG